MPNRTLYGNVWFYVALPSLLIGLVVGVVAGLLAGWIVGLIVGVILAAALIWLIERFADRWVLSRFDARPAHAVRHARLINVVEGVSAAHGLPEPELRVVKDPAANMVVIGRTPREGVLVVTSGLLERVGRLELEATVARELLRLRHGDPHLEVVAGLTTLPLAFAGDLRQRILRDAVGELRAIDLDLETALLTRYPPALARAYVTLTDAGSAVGCGTRAISHVWIAEPVGDAEPVHSDLDQRIDVLREL